MIKGIIFDMDGVLVDNSPVHVEAFMKWCESRGYYYPRDKFTNLFGLGNDGILPVVTGNPNLTSEQIKQFSEEKEEIYRQMYAESIEPMPGLVNLLEDLKKMGLKISVGSSGMRKNVNFVLEKCGIAHYFDAISDGDMVKHAKPDPEVFFTAAKLMGVEPSECLVFEDSFAGVQAARSAGMKVVVLATSLPRDAHKEYDMIIDNFTQISASQALGL